MALARGRELPEVMRKEWDCPACFIECIQNWRDQADV